MEQKNGMIVGIFSLVIGIMIVMGMMIPVVSDWTTGERTENDGAGWLRMDYTTSPSYQGIAADLSGEGVAIYNNRDGTPDGTETLIGTEDTIIYADNNLALWYESDNLFLLGQIDGEPIFVQRDDAISLIRESDGIRVSATGVPYNTKFPLPTYAYEPRSEGNYAFYSNGTPVYMESGKPNAIIGGGNVGVYAYNNIFRYAGLGLGMETEYDENGKLVSVSWDKITEEENTETPEPLGTPYIRITHENDVDDIDSISSSESGGLRAVPTPTYTDGDWGYELMTVDGVTYANIVSYSGVGDPNTDITVPATVGGYAVHTFGKESGIHHNVFDSTLECKDLIFSNGIKKIGLNACESCSKFTGSLVIPDSVTWIREYAFFGCKFAGTLTLPSVMDKIERQAFRGCPFTGTLTLPTGLTVISSYTFSYPHFTGSLVIPEGVTSIEGYAFDHCTYMTGTLTLPSTLTSIDIAAFSGGRFTGDLVIPDSVTTLGNSSFIDCRNLTGLELPNTITEIPTYCFYSCTSIPSLVIPDSVTSIGADAFHNCSKLSGKIIIPDSVTSIGNNAFQYAGKNTSYKDLVLVPNSVTSIGNNAFQGVYSDYLIIASDSIPSNSTAFQNSVRYGVLDLSDSVDYSVDRYGINANATIYDTIGDCFGYISFIEIGSDPLLTGSTAALLIAVPLLMVVGLTIAAMTVMRGRME